MAKNIASESAPVHDIRITKAVLLTILTGIGVSMTEHLQHGCTTLTGSSRLVTKGRSSYLTFLGTPDYSELERLRDIVPTRVAHQLPMPPLAELHRQQVERDPILRRLHA